MSQSNCMGVWVNSVNRPGPGVQKTAVPWNSKFDFIGMNHCKRAGCEHFLVIMAAVIAGRFIGMFSTFCKRTSRSQSESFMAHRLDVFTEIATTDFVSDLHNSSESCSNAQWSYISLFIQYYTLKNKGASNVFHSDAIEESILIPQRSIQSRVSLKNRLFLTFL